MTENDTNDKTDRVMIDIETLGLDPGAAILSIGAVRFDTHGLGEEFYRSVSLSSCQDAGLTIDAGTLDWWLGQDNSVTHVLSGGEGLGTFYRFYEHVVENIDHRAEVVVDGES